MDKPVTLIIGLGQTVGDAVTRRFIWMRDHAVLAVDPMQTCWTSSKRRRAIKSPTIMARCTPNSVCEMPWPQRSETYSFVDNVVCIPPLPEPDRLMDLDMEEFESVLMRTARGAVQTLRVFHA